MIALHARIPTQLFKMISLLRPPVLRMSRGISLSRQVSHSAQVVPLGLSWNSGSESDSHSASLQSKASLQLHFQAQGCLSIGPSSFTRVPPGNPHPPCPGHRAAAAWPQASARWRLLTTLWLCHSPFPGFSPAQPISGHVSQHLEWAPFQPQLSSAQPGPARTLSLALSLFTHNQAQRGTCVVCTDSAAKLTLQPLSVR